MIVLLRISLSLSLVPLIVALWQVYVKKENKKGGGGGKTGGRSKRSTTDRTLVIVSNYSNPSLKEKPPNVTDADGNYALTKVFITSCDSLYKFITPA